MIPFSNVLAGAWPGHLPIDYELRIGGSVEESLEMDGVIKYLLGSYDLVETEVVMTFFQSVECNIAIELAHGMRCRIHVHFC